MLKVIGASMQKTRIGTYILISAGLLVIGGFFIGYIERPKYDGTYCATVSWSKPGGFHIEYWKQQNDLLNIPKGAARICYKDTLLNDGWEQIEIETQRTFPDSVQAYGAGMLEGSLTWNSIYHQWQNVIKKSCERDAHMESYCEWLREFITKNYMELKELAQLKDEHDHFWHQIGLYLNQLEGLESGYIRGAKRARSDLENEIPFSDFLLMNSVPEIFELKNTYFYKYKEMTTLNNETDNDDIRLLPNANESSSLFNWPKTTMLMKISQQQDFSSSWQLLFGHCSVDNHTSFKRIQKRYKFHYHYSPSQRSNVVPGVDITFSGIAGILASTDDFYIVKGHLMQSIVAGVKLSATEKGTLQQQTASALTTKPIVPVLARVITANRIASNRRIWAKTLLQHTPYTAYKQWITVDVHKLAMINNLLHTKDENQTDISMLSEQREKTKDIVWIVEQLPGKYSQRSDITDRFLQKNGSTWLTNGTSYFEAPIVNASEPQFNQFELLSLEALGNYLRSYISNDDIYERTHFDIKLFSYNAKLGVQDHNGFAGPVFLRFHHILPIDGNSKNDGIINEDFQSNRNDTKFTAPNMKKQSMEYQYHSMQGT